MITDANKPPTGAWLSIGSIGLCAAAAWPVFQVVNDDAFITFVSARNFADGHGLVFTPGEVVLGTTAPLWGLLLGAASRLTGLDIILLAKAGNILCFGAAAWFLGRIVGARFGAIGAAAVAPAMFFGSPQAWTVGNELALLYLCVAVTLWASINSRLRLALVIAVLAALTRGEGVLLVPIVLWLTFRRGRSIDWREVLPAAALAGAAAFWLLWIYGDLLPNTFVAKTSERYNDWFLTALPEAIGHTFLASGILIPLSLVPLVGAVIAAFTLPEEIWIWPAAHVAGYTLINASSHPWYFHSLGFIWIVGIASAAGFVADWLSTHRLPPAVAAICVLIPLACLPTWMQWTVPHPTDYYRYSAYRQVAQDLDQRTSSSSIVAAQEIGVLGYYLHRRVVAIDFLVQRRPDVPFEERVDWLMTTVRPTIFVTTDSSPILQYSYPAQQPIVYVKRRTITGDDGRYPVAIFDSSDAGTR